MNIIKAFREFMLGSAMYQIYRNLERIEVKGGFTQSIEACVCAKRLAETNPGQCFTVIDPKGVEIASFLFTP